jgi:hypothetical protein
MKLRNLSIQLQTYGDNEGKYCGTVHYEHETHNTTLTLDTEISEKIMAFIGPVITAAATKVAKELEVSLQQSVTEANRAQLIDVGQ